MEGILIEFNEDEGVGVEQAPTPIVTGNKFPDKHICAVPVIEGLKYMVEVYSNFWPGMTWAFDVEATSREQAEQITQAKLATGEFELRLCEY